MGKFVTHLGSEVIETKANWNYSRSLLFAWAIPFYHTGLRVNVPLTSNLKVMGMVANGWNRIRENNSAKTVGVQVAWAPAEGITYLQNWISGPEREGNDTDTRTVWDAVVAVQLSERFAVNANFDYGYEQVDGTEVSWVGAAVMGKFSFAPDAALAARVEWFYDRDGWQTGVAQELREITLTGEWRANERVLLRAEIRHDRSSKNFFDSRSNLASNKGQSTAILGAIFEF
jgi:hypothetical protein